MLNNVSIVGRLVKDTDIQVIGEDNEVSRFSLAVQRDYKNREDQTVTDFIDCEVWNAGAEFLCKYAHKGDMISVSGRLQKDSWKDKDGEPRSRIYVAAQAVNIIFSGKKENTPEPQPKKKTYRK